MLSAARADDWEGLARAEDERRVILEPWMAAPAVSPGARVSPLLAQIVAADREIERLVKQRLEFLTDLLGEAALRKKAERAYGAP